MHAAIDVGSNTARLLIADFDRGALINRTYLREITRLGGRYTREKGLAADAMERTLVALEGFSRRLDQLGLKSLRVAGTEVIRKAPNQQQFISELGNRTGLTLEVLSGAEEAQLSGQGVLAELRTRPDRLLIFDLGGGSLEMILLDGKQVAWRHSQSLGVVTLAERHPSAASRAAAIGGHLEEIQAQLTRAGLVALVNSPMTQLVGTAGTVTTLAAIDRGMEFYRAELINNSSMNAAQLVAMHSKLTAMTAEERRAVKGLEPGREDLIIPGIDVVLGLMQLLGKTNLTVCDSGLLEGLILEQISRQSC